MKRNLLVLFCFALIISGCTSRKAIGSSSVAKSEEVLYQYGIIDGLLAGVFDGDLTIGSLKKKGDFGIGTFNHADGEMIVLNDTAYKVKFDGTVQTIGDADSTPLGMVKYFTPDTILYLKGNLNYDSVQHQISSLLNGNSMYAIKMSGVYNALTARAAAPGIPPYPTLSNLLKTNQHLFNFTNTRGDCIGFLLPPYMAKTNVPGFHFHYLAADKKSGGHVFAFTANSLRIEIDEIKSFYIENNTNPEFRKINLKEDRAAELKRIE